jgi:hypothetical protein
MFGVIVSGRLAQADFQCLDTNKFLLTIPEADSINHVVVFMTGITPFPPGMGGSVYFSWPDPTSPPSWTYLGFISNEKPSAIYRITKLKTNVQGAASGFALVQAIVSHNAQIGISIEPLAQLNQLTPAVPTTCDNNTFASFAIKTAENLFNYVSSFSQSLPGINYQVVPLSTVQQWYQNYLRKLEANPDFWKT